MRRNYARQKGDKGGDGCCGYVSEDPKEIIEQLVTGPMSAEAVNNLSMVQEGANRKGAGRGAVPSSGVSAGF